MKTFPLTQYSAALSFAQHKANTMGRDFGLLKAKEFSGPVYQVFGLPLPHNRSGFELRCQVVSPMIISR